MFDVKVIEDSIAPSGSRLTTLQLLYPRFIHAEFMTHRVFSRNASSSRAIPVTKMIEQVRTNPAMPIHWGKNQPGMQANEEHDQPVIIDDYEVTRELAWKLAAEEASRIAQALNRAGYHKQVVNRLLEPFLHISVVVSATEWDNFFFLRCHRDAQPEIQHLANLMRQALEGSDPFPLNPGEWHLPYVLPEERSLDLSLKVKCSTARCARVSYSNHDGTVPSVERDVELYERLVGSEPRHSSPAEHQATPGRLGLNGNFDESWTQFRQVIDTTGWPL